MLVSAPLSNTTLYSWPQKVSGHAILGRCGWQTNIWITWQHLYINTPCNSKNHSYTYVDHVYKRNSALIMAQWSSIWKYKSWACLLVCSVSEEQVTSGLCFIDWYESLPNPQSAQHYKYIRKNHCMCKIGMYICPPTSTFVLKSQILCFNGQWGAQVIPQISVECCKII